MPNPFHVTHRHRGRGVEIYLDGRIIYQLLGALQRVKRLPVIAAFCQLLAFELQYLRDDQLWSAEETGT